MPNLVDLLLGERGPLPRTIDRREHAVLDYLTTGAFFLMAGFFWGRHRRAAATALINGVMVLGATLVTDYEGGILPAIDFKTHGKLDIIQAGTAAFLPFLLGFGHRAASTPFQLQAATELAVISMTDWASTGFTAEAELPEEFRKAG